MSTKAAPAPASVVHPPVGTFIDNGSIKLVDVLGVGGYGVVYRGVDTRQALGPRSYAIKCLISGHQNPRHRQVHIREIALHQLASAHPGVVTLHRVVEEGSFTYIVMDYAPDHDLFTQILHSCRYLGDDALIKDIFLQLLDAVEYCHSLRIYHRDLKPENILCFDDGLRIAITDFGLATTDKLSDEFRTGSVYHMSPGKSFCSACCPEILITPNFTIECQGGEFAPSGKYCPMANDIWSLGIILLNLATGRNPWKSATPGDPTFQAYLRDPINFLPSVLPISAEINAILVRMLDVDWEERMTLHEVRYAIEEVTNFYSDGVLFEGSMARCPWEAGMEIDNASSSSGPEDVGPQSPPTQSTSSGFAKDVVDAHPHLESRWSKDSNSEIVLTGPCLAEGSSYGECWTKRSSCNATWGALDTPAISSNSDRDQDRFHMDLFNSTQSSQSPSSSLPTTPNSFDTSFGARLPNSKPGQRTTGLALMINTNIPRPRIYDCDAAADDSLAATYSTNTSHMHTAIEYDPYASMFYLSSPIAYSPVKDEAVILMPTVMATIAEDKEMTSPSIWTASSATEMSSPSSYSDSLPSFSNLGDESHFRRSASPSPEPVNYHSWAVFPGETKVQCPPQTCQTSSSVSTSITDVLPYSSRLTTTLYPNRQDYSATTNFTPSAEFSATRPGKSPKTLTRFAFKYFHRTPPSSPSQDSPSSEDSSRHSRAALFASGAALSCHQAASKATEQAAWHATQVGVAHGRTNEDASTAAMHDRRWDAREYNQFFLQQNEQPQPTQLRSPKQWFMRRRIRPSLGAN